MSRLLERVQQTVAEQALFGDGDVLVAGVSGGADSTAPGVPARRAGAAPRRTARRPRPPEPPAARRGRRRRGVLSRAGGPVGHRVRQPPGRRRGRVAAPQNFDRRCGANRPISVFERGRGGARRDADRGRPHAERSGRNGAAPARSRRRSGRVGGDLPEGGPGDPAAAGRAAERGGRRGCASAGSRWREDESNQDRTIPRNKVRHELLPWLIEGFGAGVVDVLARQAALSRDDAEWFELVATETADRLV